MKTSLVQSLLLISILEIMLHSRIRLNKFFLDSIIGSLLILILRIIFLITNRACFIIFLKVRTSTREQNRSQVIHTLCALKVKSWVVRSLRMIFNWIFKRLTRFRQLDLNFIAIFLSFKPSVFKFHIFNLLFEFFY